MQTKNPICLLLAFFILVSNSGLAFNLHYCEGKIANITSIFSKEEICKPNVNQAKNCCVIKDSTHQKCCTDKEVKLENKTEKIVIKTISFNLDSVFILHDFKVIDLVISPQTIISQNVTYYCDANAPPLYKLFCQYTLFG